MDDRMITYYEKMFLKQAISSIVRTKPQFRFKLIENLRELGMGNYIHPKVGIIKFYRYGGRV